jgi:purine-binding chemotaxis protein CheW
MDILAARKKAEELAKTGKVAQESAPVIPAGEAADTPAEERRPEAAPAAATSAAGTADEPASVPPATAPAEGLVQIAAAEAAPETAGESQELQEQQELEMEMLAFQLGSEEYVVPVDLVGEVLTPREITAVPHVPSYILGVCSLRGTVLPIIDLNRRLGLVGSVRDEKSRIIVIAFGPDDRVGLFVDRVRGVVRLLPSSVRPAPETVDQGAGAAFLRGIARKDDRLYILLDVEKTVGA